MSRSETPDGRLSTYSASLLCSLALLLGGACGEEAPRQLPIPTGACGLPEHEILPFNQLGRVVAHAPAEAELYTKGAVDLIVALAGVSDLFGDDIAHGAQLMTLRYTTQDKGQEVEATGLVAVPWDDLPQQRRSYPVVLFLHGTTGFMGQCAPSYNQGDGDLLPLVLLASMGYVVVAPDYIGLDAGADFSAPPDVKHAYVGIEQTAIGSLDMLRAAERLLKEEVTTEAIPTRTLVLWGGSQGGHAALACELLAPYYAPEFDLRAVVAMVPPTDLLGIAEFGLSGVYEATGGLAAVLASLHIWYEGTVGLDAVLTTTEPWVFATSVPEAMYSGCDPGGAFEGVTAVSDAFQADFIDKGLAGQWDQLEPWSCYLRENSFPWQSIPRLREDVPIYFILSENDTLVYTGAERVDFERMCGMGYRMEYLECAGASHTEGALWSLPEQTAWVKRRLAGEPVPAADLCVVRPPVACSAQQ